MNTDQANERLFQLLVSGDRAGARQFVGKLACAGWTGEEITTRVYWPVLSTIQQLHRHDQLTNLAYNYATRLLRTLVDQAWSSYTMVPHNGKRICLFCGPQEGEDLAAQIAADILEASGYEVLFCGSGIANDEILAEAAERRPNVLLMWASSASDAPSIRALIDTVRTIGALPNTSIVCGGGVFNRAPGLAEEVGADCCAANPEQLLAALNQLPQQATRRSVARRAVA
ncbi:MAG: cobalamin B12-binding domain-containing protein [Phycisphaerales bacterium]|nr:cobalamin B12-binding domain-containing protein [Phycisphaerales bacterium]